MRLMIKIALLPLIVVLWILWIAATVASRVYSVAHGLLWAILLVLIVLSCVFQLWQNALVFLALGAVSYLLLFLLTAVEVMLDTAKNSYRKGM